jgi:hypothetical protein
MSTLYCQETDKEKVISNLRVGDIVAIKLISDNRWVTAKVDVYYKPFQGRNTTDKLAFYVARLEIAIDPKGLNLPSVYSHEEFSKIIILEKK